MKTPLYINAPTESWNETTVSEDQRNAARARRANNKRLRAVAQNAAAPTLIQRLAAWLNSPAF
jgi:hypothetical protein